MNIRPYTPEDFIQVSNIYAQGKLDELVFELPKDSANKHSKWITQEMTTAIELDVPLKVDVSIGPNWLTDK